MRTFSFVLMLGLLLAVPVSHSASLRIVNARGAPFPQVMLTRTPVDVPAADLSDDGYARPGVTNPIPTVVARFCDARWQDQFRNEPIKPIPIVRVPRAMLMPISRSCRRS